MAIKIDLGKVKYTWDKETKTFTMSERDIKFDSTYEIYNPQTGGIKKFELRGSDGPEFDVNTSWYWEHKEDGKLLFTLRVCNDIHITQRAGEAYLDHKLNNHKR